MSQYLRNRAKLGWPLQKMISNDCPLVIKPGTETSNVCRWFTYSNCFFLPLSGWITREYHFEFPPRLVPNGFPPWSPLHKTPLNSGMHVSCMFPYRQDSTNLAMEHPFVICSSKCVSQEVCNIHQGIHHVISLHCIVKLHRGSSGSLIGHVLFSRIIGSNM